MLKKIYFPERILNRHVGGNTTYTRYIAAGLENRGLEIGTVPSGKHPAITALKETWFSGTHHDTESVLHFSADTGPLIKPRLPTVLTVHGVASRWISTARTNTQESVWRARVGRAIKLADQIITVSDSSADDVAEVFGIDRSRIKRIYHGIDNAAFSQRVPFSNRIEFLKGQEYVLYLGNVEPRKNIVSLLDAFSTSALRNSGVKLVIAGKPAWNSEPIMERIHSSSAIYLGFVTDDERAALMQNAALFCFPSLYEGFGFPVLEALAMGTPVLTSNKGSLAEVAGPSKVVEHLTADAIAAGIVAALGDDSWRASITETGPLWTSQFSWDASVQSHLELYNEVYSR